jgi:hypothetical protein
MEIKEIIIPKKTRIGKDYQKIEEVIEYLNQETKDPGDIINYAYLGKEKLDMQLIDKTNQIRKIKQTLIKKEKKEIKKEEKVMTINEINDILNKNLSINDGEDVIPTFGAKDGNPYVIDKNISKLFELFNKFHCKEVANLLTKTEILKKRNIQIMNEVESKNKNEKMSMVINEVFNLARLNKKFKEKAIRRTDLYKKNLEKKVLLKPIKSKIKKYIEDKYLSNLKEIDAKFIDGNINEIIEEYNLKYDNKRNNSNNSKNKYNKNQELYLFSNSDDEDIEIPSSPLKSFKKSRNKSNSKKIKIDTEGSLSSSMSPSPISLNNINKDKDKDHLIINKKNSNEYKHLKNSNFSPSKSTISKLNFFSPENKKNKEKKEDLELKKKISKLNLESENLERKNSNLSINKFENMSLVKNKKPSELNVISGDLKSLRSNDREKESEFCPSKGNLNFTSNDFIGKDSNLEDFLLNDNNINSKSNNNKNRNSQSPNSLKNSNSKKQKGKGMDYKVYNIDEVRLFDYLNELTKNSKGQFMNFKDNIVIKTLEEFFNVKEDNKIKNFENLNLNQTIKTRKFIDTLMASTKNFKMSKNEKENKFVRYSVNIDTEESQRVDNINSNNKAHILSNMNNDTLKKDNDKDKEKEINKNDYTKKYSGLKIPIIYTKCSLNSLDDKAPHKLVNSKFNIKKISENENALNENVDNKKSKFKNDFDNVNFIDNDSEITFESMQKIEMEKQRKKLRLCK